MIGALCLGPHVVTYLQYALLDDVSRLRITPSNGGLWLIA